MTHDTLQNHLKEIREKIGQLKEMEDELNRACGTLGGLLRGRLRHLDRDTLKALKHELQDYNATTRRWSDGTYTY